jgi:hypothetical protein
VLVGGHFRIPATVEQRRLNIEEAALVQSASILATLGNGKDGVLSGIRREPVDFPAWESEFRLDLPQNHCLC